MKRAISIPTRRQKGFTLVEISIAVVVAAALLFGVFWLVGVIGERSAVKDEIQNFTTLANDTRTKFRNQGSYTGITPAVLVQLGVVPPEMVRGTNIVTAWETNLDVAPTTLNGNAGDGVRFTYTLPRKSCSDFIDGVARNAARITVGGTVVKNVPGGVNTVNQANVATACNAPAGGNVTVMLDQGR